MRMESRMVGLSAHVHMWGVQVSQWPNAGTSGFVRAPTHKAKFHQRQPTPRKDWRCAKHQPEQSICSDHLNTSIDSFWHPVLSTLLDKKVSSFDPQWIKTWHFFLKRKLLPRSLNATLWVSLFAPTDLISDLNNFLQTYLGLKPKTYLFQILKAFSRSAATWTCKDLKHLRWWDWTHSFISLYRKFSIQCFVTNWSNFHNMSSGIF